MDVEDDYSYTNAEKVKILRKDPTVKSDGNGVSPEGIEDHGEEDELAKEGNNKRGGGDDLGEEEEEHREGKQDGDGQRDLAHGAHNGDGDDHDHDSDR